MNIRRWSLIVPVVAAAIWSQQAMADNTKMYPDERQALRYCGTDEVVFVNLDQGRYYHFSQPEYSQVLNGAYTCYRAARANYRPGRGSVAVTTTVTRQTTAPGLSGSSTTVTQTTVTQHR